MTWEETIQYIRLKPEFKELVEHAYFEEDLKLNVERFQKSEEFIETLKIINEFAPNTKKILDIGSGNGVSTISLALKGYQLTSVEPDSSDTIGAGAINKLKSFYKLNNVDVFEAYAEDIKFNDNTFDLVYVRQAMHHANNLNKFIEECTRVLKKGGVLMTVRDHVIYNQKDKEWFLEMHPLHKFYGGENAYTSSEYKKAFTNAGLEILLELKHYDSVINYSPLSKKQYDDLFNSKEKQIKDHLRKKIGVFSNLNLVVNMYKSKIGFSRDKVYDESTIPGRMYSYVTKKV